MHKNIINIRRSGDMWDYISIKVDIKTPEESVMTLKRKMIEFVKLNTRDFTPELLMFISEMGLGNNKMTLCFCIPIKGNWQNMLRKLAIRTKFLFQLKKQLLELDINFEMEPVPVKHINGDSWNEREMNLLPGSAAAANTAIVNSEQMMPS